MNVDLDVSKAIKGLNILEIDLGKAVEFATKRVGMIAVAEMKKQIIGGHKPGTPRSTGRGIVPNRPSNVTGNLRRSIASTVTKGFGGRYTATVGPGAAYSYYLEVTGVGKSHRKYPFVEPTGKILESDFGRLKAVYDDALTRAIRK
jgi:hypothetical protein